MKSILVVFICLVTVSIINGQNQWEIVNKGIALNLSNSNVDFINKDTGWTAGAKGLLRTFDGAESWNVVSEIELVQMDFCNVHTGWAFKWDGSDSDEFDAGIFKTLDGGVSWFEQRKIRHATDLCVISDSVVYVVDRDDVILKTVDSGASWENITPDHATGLGSLCFHSSDTGVVFCHDNNIIFRTYNGGKTWDSIHTGYEGMRNLKLIDGSSGYFIASKGETTMICKTSDTFTSWSEIAKDTAGFLLCHFFSDQSIIVVKRCSLGDWSFETYILKSTDGGLTWGQTTHIPFRLGSWRSINFFSVDEVAYLFTRSWNMNMSCISKSTDFGSNWKRLHLTFPMQDVHFLDQYNGYIGGSYHGLHFEAAILLKTQDGGGTWDPVNGEISPNICFLNESHGYSYGSGDVYTTSDGGENWVVDEALNILNLHALNDSVGWLMEYDDLPGQDQDTVHVLRTLDGGHTWDTILKFGKSDPGYYVSLSSIDENTCCAVGQEGFIAKFSKNGEWEKIESGTTLPLRKIVFIDQKYGLIAGGYSNNEDFIPIILYTEDGGDHWTLGPEIPCLIHDLQFIDSQNGIAVGVDDNGQGVILETFDRGASWTEVISGDDSLDVLLALHFKDGVVWAVGDNSLILRKEVPSTSRLEYATGNQESLFQSYPNPFSISTTISYQLLSSNYVELNIYDMFGRRVTTLVNEIRTAGIHQTEWTPPAIESGIYFCELRSSEGRQVIKMIITR